MNGCEKLATCPFFNDKMAAMPAAAEAVKQRYCLGKNTECARYMVGRAGKTVPADLFPNHGHRVKSLLNA
jgi:hypothetical protein